VKKVGIAVNNLGMSQLSYNITVEINNLLLENHSLDIVLFYENISESCMYPMFARMNISEIWSFDGMLISTDLKTSELSLKCLTPRKKIFYCWELEFLKDKNYIKNIEIYRNEELELITRSNHYAKALENYCNRKPYVVENFNLRKIIDEYYKF